MRFPRIRYSLRTLLLASLLAGGGMLVWRVSEPWALRVWPIKNLPTEKDRTEPQLHFSRTGTVLLVQADLKPFLSKSPISVLNVLDTADGHELDLAGPCTFALRRTVLICEQRCSSDPKLVVLNTVEMKIASEIPLFDSNSSCILSPDERLVYCVGLARSSDSNPMVACIDIATGERRWCWPVSPDAASVELNWDSEKTDALRITTRRSRRGHRDLGDAEIDRAYLHNSARGGAIVTQVLDAESEEPTGEATSISDEEAAEQRIAEIKKSLEKIQREFDERVAAYNRNLKLPSPPINVLTNLARDGSWRFVVKTDTGVITVSDAKNFRDLFVLHAPSAMLRGPLEVSDDKQRIAACFDPNSLAIWSRTRQHFEWWGLYERPETWLAFALLCAFLWSVWRDYAAGKS